MPCLAFFEIPSRLSSRLYSPIAALAALQLGRRKVPKMSTSFPRTLQIVRKGIALWLQHNAFLHAGALAFFTLFSLAPTLIIAVTVIGVVLGEEAARGRIVAQLQDTMGAEAAVFVEHAVLAARIDEAGLMPTVIGVGALLIGATTVFGQLRYSLNLLWGVRSGNRRGRLAPLGQFAKTRFLSLLVVLMWVYFSALLLLLGAALTRASIDF